MWILLWRGQTLPFDGERQGSGEHVQLEILLWPVLENANFCSVILSKFSVLRREHQILCLHEAPGYSRVVRSRMLPGG